MNHDEIMCELRKKQLAQETKDGCLECESDCTRCGKPRTPLHIAALHAKLEALVRNRSQLQPENNRYYLLVAKVDLKQMDDILRQLDELRKGEK